MVVRMKDAETPVQRAIREANEQEAELAAQRELALAVDPKPEQPEPRILQLVLQVKYDASGRCVGIDGFCQGVRVLAWKGRGDNDVGAAATETLRLGGLKALLG